MTGPAKRYRLEIRMTIREVDERGSWIGSGGAFELSDSVDLPGLGFRDMVAVMSNVHGVFEKLPEGGKRD